MEQDMEKNVQPQIKNATINNQKSNKGCLWFLLGFVAFCFVVFGAVAIFAAVIASAFTDIKEKTDNQFESYERKFISAVNLHAILFW